MFLVREVRRLSWVFTFLTFLAQRFYFIVLLWPFKNKQISCLPNPFGGTQRLFPVKYLFGEANINLNFLVLEDGLKISRWLFHSCTIFVAYLIDSYDSLKFNFSHFTPRLGFFRRKKRNLKFSDSKIWWREKTEKSSLSKYVKLYLKFSGK